MYRWWVEKFSSSGALLAALTCPICFPKLAIIGAAVGLGVFAPYERYLALAVQVFFVIALIGQVIAFRMHRNRRLLVLAMLSTLTLFAGYYVIPSTILLQLALAGLVIGSIWQFVEMRRCAQCQPITSTDT